MLKGSHIRGSLLYHTCLEPNFIYLSDDLGFCQLIWLKIDLSPLFFVTYHCLFHAIKPFQGLFDNQWSGCSGHAFNSENDFFRFDGI